MGVRLAGVLLYNSIRAVKHVFDYLWTYLLVLLNFVIPGNRLRLGRWARVSIGSLVFGNVFLDDYTYVGPFCVITGYVRIGKGTILNGHTVIRAGRTQDSGVFIGNYCAFGTHIAMFATNHDYVYVPIQYTLSRRIGISPGRLSKGPISIGHDVWVGYHSTFLSGATVGNGAVIGACSVVTKRIPSYSVAAGVPARVVGTRFPENIIKYLEESTWWLLDPADLSRISDAFGKISCESDAKTLYQRVIGLRKSRGDTHV